MLAAAARHEVWVLTTDTSAPALRQTLADHPLGARVHLELVPLGVDEKRLNRAMFHWYYDRWQRRARKRAIELDHQIGFDVVHHVTMSTVWTRVGVAAVPKPLVWGPVGGGVEPPLNLLPALGARGFVDDMLRVGGRRLLARLPPMRAAPRTAVVVLAQNHETVRRMRTNASVSVLTNATAVELDGLRCQEARTREVLLVGRILPWKGGSLAIRALRQLRDPQAVLRVYGSGADRPRLERAARRWGLADRVRFEQWIPRDDLLLEVARAGALVYPSLHDDAGMCVAEALSLGTPVVCLDHGGPAEVVRCWPASPSRLVTPAGPETTVRRIAEAIDGFLANPPPIPASPLRPRPSFGDSLLEAYEAATTSTVVS